MVSNDRTFGRNAGRYKAGRVDYPSELFAWIADEAPATDAVWDVATGTGRAATALREHFAQVFATDIDAAQLAKAEPRAGITYQQAPAEASALADQSVDAVTVATALHWFDFEAFWAEVRRVARPQALFCAFVYDLPRGDDRLEAELLQPLRAVLDPFWAEGNRLAMRGYPPAEVAFPFEPVTPPPFELEHRWSIERLLAFAHTWSAHVRAHDEGEGETLHRLEERARETFGPQVLEISQPLYLLAGRIA